MNRIQVKPTAGAGRARPSIGARASSGPAAPASVVPAAYPPASRAKTENLSDRKLALNVAFTSGPATAAALRRASVMAQGLGAKLRVIVAQIVPYGRHLDDPDVDTRFTVNYALDAARDAEVDADVHVVLCRDRVQGLHSALGRDGILLIAGASRWWELRERLFARQTVRRLAALGHKVLFVEATE